MQRCVELEEFVAEWFAAASRGDASLVDARVAPGPETRLVGSDPDEWLQGGPTVAAFLRGEVDGSGGEAAFTPSATEAFADGRIGWAATKLTIRLPDGRTVSPRWTAVFHHDGDAWTFVQTHASIAVPNDEIGWTYT